MWLRAPALESLRLAAALRDLVQRIAPDVPISRVVPMAARVSTVISQPRALARLVIGFAVAALLLSITGMYSVMSWSVSQRRREIGLRIAIGGTPPSVCCGMVLLGGLRLIAVAIPIGLGGGFILAGAMSSLLFGIQPLDPVTFAGAAILLAVVALLATLVPAMRATRIDP